MEKSTEQRILDFQERSKIEPEICKELFRCATIRILAHKYAYYRLDNAFVDDFSYDLEEKYWYIMGRGLGELKEDETSPCIDFDYNHPYANMAIALAKKLKKRK